MDQATLLGTSKAVVSGIEIADQRAGKGLAQDTLNHVATAVFIDEKDGQLRVAETPSPGGLAVDAPARFVPLHDRRLPQAFEQFLDNGFEQGAAPTQMAEQAGPADGQAEEVVQEVACFAE